MAEAVTHFETCFHFHIYKLICEYCIPSDPCLKKKIDKEDTALVDAYSRRPVPYEVDFNKLEKKSAYMYRYFTWTVYAVSESWQYFHSNAKTQLDSWLKDLSTKDLHVVSIGGGPATDIVGLCHWLYNRRPLLTRNQVKCTIVDKYDWSEETRALLAKFDICMKYDSSNRRYCHCDFMDEDFLAITNRYMEDVDIITFVNFFTAIVCEVEDELKLKRRLKEVLARLPANTLIMFMDSVGNSSASIVCYCAALQECGLTFVSGIKDLHVEVPIHEKTRIDSNNLRGVFMPRTVHSVTANLFRKPGMRYSTENDGQHK